MAHGSRPSSSDIMSACKELTGSQLVPARYHLFPASPRTCRFPKERAASNYDSYPKESSYTSYIMPARQPAAVGTHAPPSATPRTAIGCLLLIRRWRGP